MSQDTAKVVAVKKPGTVSNTEVAARVTVLGAIGTGLFTIVDKATQNPAVMAAILGSVSMIPAVGQAVIALGAVIAVGVYAAKLIKEQFSKYLKMLRTIDEFTILLHKIQKISNLTIFISTTYNFDINIDEVIEQMKIIFSRFDQVLKLEPNSYNKIESQVMNPLTATPDIEEEAQGAITRAAMLEIKSNDPSQELPTGQKGGGFDGEYDSQTGGAPLWWERFQFNVQAWNKNLNTDIIKLNIYLTTTMSEFSIILNVIQMNMIVNGLGQNPQEKTKAITELTKKNFVIKYSSEYQKTRIGILLHDILKLRVDLVYCKAQAGKSPLVSMQSDAVCKEHIAKYNTGYMFTTFRSDLHRFINKLIIRLKDGDYDNALKQSVCNYVLLPYSNMLNKARLVAPTDKREVLDAFELKSLTPQNVADINAKLDEFIAGIPKNLAMLTVPAPGAAAPAPSAGNGKPVMTGGLFGFGSSKPVGDLNPTETAAEWNARIAKMDKDKKSLNLLMAEPYNLVTDDELNLFLRNIYDYTKKVSQTKPEEIKKALEVAEEMTRPPPAKTVFGSVTAAASNALNNITQSISPDTKEKIDAAKQVAAQKLGDVKSAASNALNNLTQSISPDAKEKIDAAKQVAAEKIAEKAAAAKNFFSGLMGAKPNPEGGNRRLTRKRARDVKRKTYRYKVKI